MTNSTTVWRNRIIWVLSPTFFLCSGSQIYELLLLTRTTSQDNAWFIHLFIKLHQRSIICQVNGKHIQTTHCCALTLFLPASLWQSSDTRKRPYLKQGRCRLTHSRPKTLQDPKPMQPDGAFFRVSCMVKNKVSELQLWSSTTQK